ncbi:MAG: Sir2 family NAD-dependent protein deacetylase [Butyribacter sp.]|nr:NAD-dependent deacetylase [bacterium]MDY3854555.1 Sir2 family NAD-dependent protein deacetylase [Butyribacter sp.]
MEQKLDKIREVIRSSNNIVLVSGSEVLHEAGLNGIRGEKIVYEVEEKYGYSGDEIVSSLFFSRRVDTFYDYYKNVILDDSKKKPSNVYKATAALERAGKVKTVVTRMIYGNYQKAGCEEVVELYGSAEENRCPICGKVFGSDYIRKSDGIPKCDVCGVTLRPGFTLFGEMIDNGRLTKASNAIEEADVLIVLGISLNSVTWANMLRYYEGNKMILINTEEKTGDERANYRAYGNISDIYTYVTDYDKIQDDIKKE